MYCWTGKPVSGEIAAQVRQSLSNRPSHTAIHARLLCTACEDAVMVFQLRSVLRLLALNHPAVLHKIACFPPFALKLVHSQ